MLSEIEIKECKEESILKDLKNLEKELFGEKAWSENLLKEELRNSSSVILVAKKKDGLLGYLIGKFILDEGELLRIGVKFEHQRKGLGKKLLKHFLEMAKSKGIKKIFLEVSEINKKALFLYQKMGFIPYNFRKNYYGEESAILMKKDLL